MSVFYAGDRVRVAPHWNAFYAMQGRVVAVNPIMVLLDGFTKPIRLEAVSLALVVDVPVAAAENLTGAE